MWCRYLDDPLRQPPRVAFAIGRPVGNAVSRNRLRRRLRELLRGAAGTTIHRSSPTGSCWSAPRPAAAERSFDELGADVTVAAATSAAPGPSAGPA